MAGSLTRRKILKCGGALAAGLGSVAAPRAIAAPKASVESTKIITSRPHLYHGWPTLARRGNGELLVVCSGGRESHVCPFGRVELMRSMADAPMAAQSLKSAIQHRDIITRFGRFPHRNAVLGRVSSAEEAAFLEGPDSSF